MDDSASDQSYRVTAEELRQFIERFERLEAEKKDIADQQKEVMAEAKGRGYDTKVMRKVIALRKRDKPTTSPKKKRCWRCTRKRLGCDAAYGVISVTSGMTEIRSRSSCIDFVRSRHVDGVRTSISGPRSISVSVGGRILDCVQLRGRSATAFLRLDWRRSPETRASRKSTSRGAWPSATDDGDPACRTVAEVDSPGKPWIVPGDLAG